jgi:hypothetical protein
MWPSVIYGTSDFIYLTCLANVERAMLSLRCRFSCAKAVDWLRQLFKLTLQIERYKKIYFNNLAK